MHILRHQLWANFGPPTPSCVINIIMALDPPPPLKWWCNMWTEGELLDDFSDTFQIIKICFSTIIRTIFWGLELYSRILSHDSWRNSLIYSWFQVFYSNTCSMFQVSHPSTFQVSAQHHFALAPPTPPKGTINVIICAWTPHPPLTWWCNMCTVLMPFFSINCNSYKKRIWFYIKFSMPF